MDEWPIEWSGGWLLSEAVLLDTDPKKFYQGGIGFTDEAATHDEWLAGIGNVDPPDGWENLPVYEPREVSGGE